MQTRRLVFGLMSLVVAASASARIETLLPETSEERPSVTLEYAVIPFDSFSYVNGKVVAQWDARRYRIEEVWLTADLEAETRYTPGFPMKIAIDEGKRRYDFVGWMTERETGERKRFITHVWTPEALASEIDRNPGRDLPTACALDEDVQCPDGSTVRVRCEGQTGSCSSCSTGKQACCRATTKQRFVGANGRVQELEIITTETQSCPNVSPSPIR